MATDIEYKFLREWDDTDADLPSWALRGRKALNCAIRAYNDWQLTGCRSMYVDGLLARIEWGRAQCSVDGGEEWIAEIDRMREAVLEINKTIH